MDCKQLRENISLFIDGKLSDEELAGLKEHIKKCKECAKVLEDTQFAVASARGSAKESLPEGFYTKLDRKLDEVDDKARSTGFIWNRAYLLRGAATAFAAIIVIFAVKEFQKSPEMLRQKTVMKEQGRAGEARSRLDVSEPLQKNRKQAVDELEKAKPAAVETKPVLKREEKDDSSGISAERQEESVSEMKPGQAESVAGMKRGAESLRSNAVKEEITASGEIEQYSDKAPGPERPMAGFAAKKSIKGQMEMKSLPAPASPAAADSVVQAQKEWIGQDCGYKGSDKLVFKGLVKWAEFLDKNPGVGNLSPALRSIDFNNEMVIAVFMGEKSTGGYSTKITNTAELKNKLVVSYKDSVPATGTATIQVLTYPYHIKVINKSNLPVVFEQIK